MAKKIRMKLPSSWSVQAVTPRMRKPCCQCEEVPESVRFVRRIDSYPYPTEALYCTKCAVAGMRAKLLTDETLIAACEATLQAQYPTAVAPS